MRDYVESSWLRPIWCRLMYIGVLTRQGFNSALFLVVCCMYDMWDHWLSWIQFRKGFFLRSIHFALLCIHLVILISIKRKRLISVRGFFSIIVSYCRCLDIMEKRATNKMLQSKHTNNPWACAAGKRTWKHLHNISKWSPLMMMFGGPKNDENVLIFYIWFALKEKEKTNKT